MLKLDKEVAERMMLLAEVRSNIIEVVQTYFPSIKVESKQVGFQYTMDFTLEVADGRKLGCAICMDLATDYLMQFERMSFVVCDKFARTIMKEGIPWEASWLIKTKWKDPSFLTNTN